MADDHIIITEQLLDPNAIIDLVMHSTCGAVSTFIGTTRDTFDDKHVTKLSYECYESMAVAKISADICKPIREKWPEVRSIAIAHRTGEVPVSHISCIIAVSSIHRTESLRAVEFAIEALKRCVPIWKKEIYSDADPLWKENIKV